MGWGQLKEQRDSHIQGNSLTNGKSVGIEEKHLELSEESKRAILGQEGQSETYTDDLGLCVSAWNTCLPVCTGPGCWIMSKPRERTATGCEEKA